MPTDVLFAYAATALGISTILTEWIKRVLIAPNVLESKRRDDLLLGINYALNLILILIAVITHGEFKAADILTYIGLSVGQFVVAQGGYALISNTKKNTQNKQPPQMPES